MADKENDNFDGSGVVTKQLSKDIVNYNKANEIITGTVTDGVGRVGTCSVSITRDDEIPNITAQSDENKILNTDNKAITDYFDIKYGVSGGNTVCKVGTKVISNISDLTLGINTVTCTATGNNGMTSSATTKFIHQYYADSKCSQGNLNSSKTSCSYCNNYGWVCGAGGALDSVSHVCTYNDGTEYYCTSGTLSGDKCVTTTNSSPTSKTTYSYGYKWTAQMCSQQNGTFTQDSSSTGNSTGTCKYNPVTKYYCGSTEVSKSSTCSSTKSESASSRPKYRYDNATYQCTSSGTIKPTYSCPTTGTNTSTNTTVSPELGDAICPGNKCSSVPLCTFKEN